LPVELLPRMPEGAAQLAHHAAENAPLALGRLEPGKLGADVVDQLFVGSQVDRRAPALFVAHHEQMVRSGSPPSPATPGLGKKALPGKQLTMFGDEPGDGLAALVVGIAIFQN